MEIFFTPGIMHYSIWLYFHEGGMLGQIFGGNCFREDVDELGIFVISDVFR